MNPLVVSFGGGVDSTAMLLGFAERGIVPDAIVFADTGSEKPETYTFLRERLPALLEGLGFPALTIVRYRPERPRNGAYTTLEEQCLVNRTLPSRAFGMGKCSQKWKGEPIDAWVAERFAEHIAAGGVVDRAIGYDASEHRRCGGYRPLNAPHWRWVYPLRDWGWTRATCEMVLREWGLDGDVVKSACFFCPAMRPEEVAALARRHPELAARAVAVEDAGRPWARKVTGLWRRPCKGTRGATPHDGTWRGYLDELGLLPAESVIRAYRRRVASSKPERPEPETAAARAA